MTNENIKIGNLGGGGGYLAALIESRGFQWLFVLSCVATVAGSHKPNIPTLLSCLLAFFLARHLVFNKQILTHLFEPYSQTTLYIALATSLVSVGFSGSFCFHYLFNKFPDFPYRVQSQIGIPQELHTTFIYLFGYAGLYCLYLTTVPVFIAFFYAFILRFAVFFKELYLSSDKIERYYFVTVMIIAVIALSIIYNQTNCFYAPAEQGTTIIDYDIVYTSDSGSYYKTNTYGFIGANENDMRQPLFDLFAMPFAVLATLLSWVFFFIPNCYAVFIQAIQVGLLAATYIIMGRLLRLDGLRKIFFFIVLVFTYPVLLFSLMWEQYIFALFWLFVYIYAQFTNKQEQHLLFTAATGSLLTNAAAFLFTLTKDRMVWFKNGLQALGYFLIFCILTGQLVEFSQFLRLRSFIGVKLAFYDKFLQFVNFIYSCFIKPETVILQPFLNWTNHGQNYQLAPVESLNILGLILLGIALLGFVLNYKDKFAQICAFWIAFSFFVLCLVGWGTTENGLILYSLYFGWAYFCLVFLAIETLLQKLPAVKYTVYTACIAALAYINIPAMYDLIQFGIKYYPCP